MSARSRLYPSYAPGDRRDQFERYCQPMNAVFDLCHSVADEEIDAQNHVHNLRYLQWTLWAAGKHSAACGWNSAAELERGFGWVVRSHDVTYKAAAMANDDLVVRTWVSEVSRFASRRKYVICRPADQSVLARIETRWVYVDLKRHRIVPIPEHVAQMITVLDAPPCLPWDDDQ